MDSQEEPLIENDQNCPTVLEKTLQDALQIKLEQITTKMNETATKGEIVELQFLMQDLEQRLKKFDEEEAFEKKRVTDLVTTTKFIMQSNEQLQTDITKLKVQHMGLDSLVQKEFENLR